MTVSYQYDVASSTSGGFTKLLLKWKGSVYKLIYRELVLFLFVFSLISVMYRWALNEDMKRVFEKIVNYCDTFVNLIPLSFVLGFYVSFVATRWWQQFIAIPWPDKLMHSIALVVDGHDEMTRMIRRNLMRYINLSLVLVLRSISSSVKKRFPTVGHVVDAGFMTKDELEILESVSSGEFNTYWVPCVWFTLLVKKAYKKNRILNDHGLQLLMGEFNEFRGKMGLLWCYDWVSIPLVYTQVVTIATYAFFVACLVGRQYVENTQNPYKLKVDIYVPVFTILQFFFYMGLLKVAEQLINPFGDDDEDFELNWIIDRHIKVSYLGVDYLMTRPPPLVKDMYFEDQDIQLPYTEASVAFKKRTYRGSVANMNIPEDKQSLVLPEIVEGKEFKRNLHPHRSSLMNILSVHRNDQDRTHPSEGSLKKRGSISIPLQTIATESPENNTSSAPNSGIPSLRLELEHCNRSQADQEDGSTNQSRPLTFVKVDSVDYSPSEATDKYPEGLIPLSVSQYYDNLKKMAKNEPPPPPPKVEKKPTLLSKVFPPAKLPSLSKFKRGEEGSKARKRLSLRARLYRPFAKPFSEENLADLESGPGIDNLGQQSEDDLSTSSGDSNEHPDSRKGSLYMTPAQSLTLSRCPDRATAPATSSILCELPRGTKRPPIVKKTALSSPSVVKEGLICRKRSRSYPQTKLPSSVDPQARSNFLSLPSVLHSCQLLPRPLHVYHEDLPPTPRVEFKSSLATPEPSYEHL